MLHRATFAALLVAAAGTLVGAQSSQNGTSADTVQPTEQRTRFRASADLVSIAVVVRGPDGRIVEDLQARDFEVLDCGTAQQIVQFQQGRDADARLAVLVDSSGSMALGAKRQRSRLATEFLMAGFKESDAASVFSFDSRVRRLTPYTRDREELRAAVTSVEPYGATSLYDAIVGTVRTVTDEGPRTRALLLLTDGIDTWSVHSPADAASAAAALDIPLYVLSVGDDVPRPTEAAPVRDAGALTLHDLATRTGGLAAEATTIAQMSVATRAILAELRHQYVLGIPAGAVKGWHDLTVRVRRGRVQARSREGYLVS